MPAVSCPTRGALVRVRSERWRVERSLPHEGGAVLDVIGIDTGNRGRAATFVLPFEICDLLPLPSPKYVTARGWRRLARRILGEATGSPFELRSAAHARFRVMPFQLEPALAYVRGEATRMLVADAVGLGKTVQAGLIVAEMLERQGDGRALIVVPASLREQWHRELHHHFGIDAHVIDASALWRLVSTLPPGVNPWTIGRVIVTSIDFVKRPEILRALEPLIWEVVVLDEAHALAGASDRHAAAGGLAARARAVVLLTATPHDGDDRAFARLCALGNLEDKFPLLVFRRTRAALGVGSPRRSLWLRLNAGGEEIALRTELFRYAQQIWQDPSTPGAQLAVLVLLKRAASNPVALLRSLVRRRELLGDGPAPPAEDQLPLPLAPIDDDEPSTELAAPGLRDRQEEFATLDRLIALARAAAPGARKVERLARALRRLREPAIVFTQYRDTLEELRFQLSPLALTAIHGGMTSRPRAEAVRSFTGGEANVLLATDAASEGLNLHGRCRLIINFDLPWTPLRLEQRSGRVDRIGQARRVHVWHLIVCHTYEEVVVERLRARAATVTAALTGFGADDERAIAGRLLDGRPSDATAPDVARGGRSPDEDPSDAAAIRRPAPAIALAAETEGRRLLTARALLTRAAALGADRPFILNDRRRPLVRLMLLVFQLRFSGTGPCVWDTVAAALIDRRRRSPGSPQEWLRQSTDLGPAVADEGARRLHAELVAWRRRAATAIVRDRAMARRLRVDHARLAARLMQRDLFSHRGERALESQRQLMDQSLASLRAASRGAAAAGRLRLDEITLLFAGPTGE